MFVIEIETVYINEKFVKLDGGSEISADEL